MRCGHSLMKRSEGSLLESCSFPLSTCTLEGAERSQNHTASDDGWRTTQPQHLNVLLILPLLTQNEQTQCMTYADVHQMNRDAVAMTAMGTLASLTPILGWLFLPRILADALLRTVYSSLPAYRPTTQRQAQLHARAAHVLVVSCYLIYTFINAYRSVKASPNFYALLDLEPLHGSEMDDEEWSKLLKATWRKLARSMHPDKIGKSPAAEAYFVQMRRAYETLSDPYTKIAYNRFGWTVIEACAGKCKTLREFAIVGLQQSGELKVLVGSF